MALYEVCIAGNPTATQVADVKAALEASLAPQGKTLGTDVGLHLLPPNFDPSDRSVSVVVYFGGPNHSVTSVERAMRRGTPVIPVVSNPSHVAAEMPGSLSSLNCLSFDIREANAWQPQ